MSDDELRDTGRQPKIANEREHMSHAGAFDDLVSANLSLVRTLRRSVWIFVLCGVVITVVTLLSAVTLHLSQDATRHLIRTLDHMNCQEKEQR
ncbi:MAG: hypothetical protein M3Y26_00375 [Actinomycetota bacterium]|nr:hypothetical protein [Actinomycetota bacterium]